MQIYTHRVGRTTALIVADKDKYIYKEDSNLSEIIMVRKGLSMIKNRKSLEKPSQIEIFANGIDNQIIKDDLYIQRLGLPIVYDKSLYNDYMAKECYISAKKSDEDIFKYCEYRRKNYCRE